MKLATKGKAMLWLKIGPFRWRVNFIVAEGLDIDVILGNDVLRSCGMLLDLSYGYLRFTFSSKYSIPFLESKSKPICKSISVTGEQPFVMSSKDKASLNNLLREFKDVVNDSIGRATKYAYKINVKDDLPVRRPPYPLTPPKAAEMKGHIQKLLSEGIIEPSKSPYGAPAFLISKSNGEKRLCVDYRHLNKKIVYDSFPSPSLEHAFQVLNGAQVFSTIDLNSAFYQVPLTKESKGLTTFLVPHGAFQFKYTPFGLCVSPQALNRIIFDLFSDLTYKFVYPYLDDLLVYSESLESHLEHLREVFSRLRSVGFTANPEKMSLCKSRVKFLGHILTSEGILTNPDKVSAIKDLPAPKTLKQLRSFLGMVGFFSRFIPDFAVTAAPLNQLRKKGVRFRMGRTELDAFDALRSKLCSPPLLIYPDFSKNFVLQTDASDVAIGAVLLQEVDGNLRPVQYASRKLNPAEKNYPIYERECLAAVWAVERFAPYLEIRPFVLQTDNAALSWMVEHPKQLGRIGRWVLRLSRFKFTVQHIRGTLNPVADCLSRLFVITSEPQATVNLLHHIPESFKTISAHQKEDPETSLILDHLHAGQDAVGYTVQRGLLMKAVGRQKKKKVVVPSAVRNMLLFYHHDLDSAGHRGITKTFRSLAKSFWWRNMYADTVHYVRSCELCQRSKAMNTSPAGLLCSEPPSRPWERVYVDFVGPMTRSSRGNQYVLSVIDGFSKWAELLPTRQATAEVVCTRLTEQLWSRYGPPATIVTDNARCFTSERFRHMCLAWGIHHVTTTPYRPQANLAERLNRDLKSHLSILVNQLGRTHRDWDRYLGYVAMSHNSSRHEAIDATPSEVFLGRRTPSALENRWDLHHVSGTERTPAVEDVQRALKAAHRKMARLYNPKRRNVIFEVGQLVVQKLHHLPRPGETEVNKLKWRYSEPRRVLQILSPVNLLLQEIEHPEVTHRVHVDQVKLFVSR